MTLKIAQPKPHAKRALQVGPLIVRGYKPGPPPTPAGQTAFRIDTLPVKRMKCGSCGCRPMLAHPFYRPLGGYVVLAECRTCGAVEEF